MLEEEEELNILFLSTYDEFEKDRRVEHSQPTKEIEIKQKSTNICIRS